MSRSIDERIVEMRFDNRDFESNVQTSMKTLESFKQALKLDNVADGFGEIEKAANRMDLRNISSGIEAIERRFSTLGIVGMEVIQKLTDGFLNFAQRGITAVLGKIASGGKKRAFNIEQAHFQLQGLLKDEAKVQAVMDDAMDSVTDTAYGYDEAAKAASMFAASGVQAGEEMQKNLKGLAGVAAMTNAPYENIANIFTTISGQGRILGNQLNQFAAQGLNVAATIADYYTEIKGVAATEQDIRDIISDPKSNLAAQDFFDAMAWAFGEQAKKANETVTGAWANVGAALSRIGAKFYSPLIEQNGALVKLFNVLKARINDINKGIDPIANIVTGNIKTIATAMADFMDNTNLQDTIGQIMTKLSSIFADSVLVIKNFGKLFLSIITPIGKAFRLSFGYDILGRLTNFASKLQLITQDMKLSSYTSKLLQKTFSGLFRIFDIAAQAVTALIRVFAPSRSELKFFANEILGVTASIGDWITALDRSIKQNDTFFKAFSKVKDILTTVARAIGRAILEIEHAFMDAENAIRKFVSTSKTIEAIKDNFIKLISAIKEFVMTKIASPDMSGLDVLNEKLQSILEPLKKVGAFIDENIAKLIIALAKAASKIPALVTTIATAVMDFIRNLNLPIRKDGQLSLLDLLNGGLLTAIGVGITTVINNITHLENAFGKLISDYGSIAVKIKTLIGGVTETFRQLQSDLKADILLKIAAAIGVLAVSFLVLASIDPKRLTPAIGAITGLFAELMGSMKVLTMFTGSFGIQEMGIIGNALLKMSAAVLIMAAALKTIGSLDEESLTNSFLAISGLMWELVGVAYTLSKNETLMYKGIEGLISFAIAMRIMASAIKTLSSLSLSEIVIGVGGLGIAMNVLVNSMNSIAYDDVIQVGTGMLLLSVGMIALATALKIMGSLDLKQMITALAALAGSMLILVMVFGEIKYDDYVKVGAGMLIMASAMVVLGIALKIMGSLNLGQLITALVALSGSMLILVMTFNEIKYNDMVKVAAGILVMATAMGILAVALKIMGSMDFPELITALVALAGSMLIIVMAFNEIRSSDMLKIAGAMLVMSVAISVLATALRLMGGMSVDQMAIALITLAASFLIIGLAAGAFEPVIPAIVAFAGAIALLGIAVAAVGAGVALFAFGMATLAASGVAGAAAFVSMMSIIVTFLPTVAKAMANAIISFAIALAAGAGELMDALHTLIVAALDTLIEALPKFEEAVMAAVDSICEMLGACVPKFINTALTILVALLTAIRDNIGQVIMLAYEIVINFMKGLIAKIPEIVDTAIKLAITLIDSLATGINENADQFITAFENLLDAVLSLLGKYVTKFGPKGVDFIAGLLSGINKMRESVMKAIVDLAFKILQKFGLKEDYIKKGKDFMYGLIEGITKLTDMVINTVKGIGHKIIDGLKSSLDEHSPSKEAYKIGEFFMVGMNNGLKEYGKRVEGSAVEVGEDILDTFKVTMSKISDYISADYQPTITPVVDLSNVTAGAGDINSLFDNTKTQELAWQASADGNFNVMTDLSRALNAKLDKFNNDDVVGELTGLRGDVTDLATAMSRLNVIMDTGTLVGALGPGMDTYLGNQAVLAGRGV